MFRRRLSSNPWTRHCACKSTMTLRTSPRDAAMCRAVLPPHKYGRLSRPRATPESSWAPRSTSAPTAAWFVVSAAMCSALSPEKFRASTNGTSPIRSLTIVCDRFAPSRRVSKMICRQLALQYAAATCRQLFPRRLKTNGSAPSSSSIRTTVVAATVRTLHAKCKAVLPNRSLAFRNSAYASDDPRNSSAAHSSVLTTSVFVVRRPLELLSLPERTARCRRVRRLKNETEVRAEGDRSAIVRRAGRSPRVTARRSAFASRRRPCLWREIRAPIRPTRSPGYCTTTLRTPGAQGALYPRHWTLYHLGVLTCVCVSTGPVWVSWLENFLNIQVNFESHSPFFQFDSHL